MIDKDLENAYQKAIYRTFKPSISWKVGQISKEIDELLLQYDVTVAAFVTAYNPGSKLLTPAENRQRNLALRQVIEKREYSFLEGQGEDPQGQWPAEASFLIIGMDQEEARALGRRFGQNAVLIVRPEQAVSLVFCSD